jgi:hypothetical protein
MIEVFSRQTGCLEWLYSAKRAHSGRQTIIDNLVMPIPDFQSSQNIEGDAEEIFCRFSNGPGEIFIPQANRGSIEHRRNIVLRRERIEDLEALFLSYLLCGLTEGFELCP